MKLFSLLLLSNFALCFAAHCTPAHPLAIYDQKTTDTSLKPFELIVVEADYAVGYSLHYVLTENDLRILFKEGVAGEKDSTIFKTALKPHPTLKRLSNININTLEEYYSNTCIPDGSQVTAVLTKDNMSKTVHLSNYYQADIGSAIELINSMTPGKYKIWYDKATLLKDQEKCK
jgi:hypothetical protein